MLLPPDCRHTWKVAAGASGVVAAQCSSIAWMVWRAYAPAAGPSCRGLKVLRITAVRSSEGMMLSSSSAQLGTAAMFASSTCGSAQRVAGHAT